MGVDVVHGAGRRAGAQRARLALDVGPDLALVGARPFRSRRARGSVAPCAVEAPIGGLRRRRERRRGGDAASVRPRRSSPGRGAWRRPRPAPETSKVRFCCAPSTPRLEQQHRAGRRVLDQQVIDGGVALELADAKASRAPDRRRDSAGAAAGRRSETASPPAIAGLAERGSARNASRVCGDSAGCVCRLMYCPAACDARNLTRSSARPRRWCSLGPVGRVTHCGSSEPHIGHHLGKAFSRRTPSQNSGVASDHLARQTSQRTLARVIACGSRSMSTRPSGSQTRR